MSNKASSYENHQLANELRDGPAHAHRVAEQQGKQDHLAGTELSRQAHEHSEQPQGASLNATAGHGVVAFGHEDIAALAHHLWQARGCPEGSSDVDWFQAAEQLRARSYTHLAKAATA
jgi:Protein of unknown function (DUF2934)